MPIMKISLVILLLTLLSGTFSFDRLFTGITFEVRYLLFLLFVIVLLLGVSRINEKKNKFVVNNHLFYFLLSFFLYFFFLTISFFYTPDQSYSIPKYLLICFLAILILSIVVLLNYIEIDDFFNTISLFFIIFGIVYSLPIYLSVLLGADRGDVNLSGPNVTTRIIFFAVCSSLYRYFIFKKNVYFVISILFIGSIILVGSRGGLVGCLVSLLALFLVKKTLFRLKIRKRKYWSFKKLLLLPLGLGILYLIYEPIKKVFMNRIIGTTFGSDKVYTSGRDVLYLEAFEMIKEQPIFGHGIEAFIFKTGHIYPHNLLLEMMLEIGIIGAIIFMAFLFFSIFIIVKTRNSSFFIFSGIPLYMITVQMFSGEFYDFRYFFFWSIAMLFYRHLDKKLK